MMPAYSKVSKQRLLWIVIQYWYFLPMTRWDFLTDTCRFTHTQYIVIIGSCIRHFAVGWTVRHLHVDKQSSTNAISDALHHA